jgi:hypothetical protein
MKKVTVRYYKTKELKYLFTTHRRKLQHLWVLQDKDCSVRLRGTYNKQGGCGWTLCTFRDDHPVEITKDEFEAYLFISHI